MQAALDIELLISFFLRRLGMQLEKLELSEHCDRMLAALWSFKAELTDSKSPSRVDEDTNAKFGKLMAKLEEISIRLSERDIDYRLLSGKTLGGRLAHKSGI